MVCTLLRKNILFVGQVVGGVRAHDVGMSGRQDGKSAARQLE